MEIKIITASNKLSIDELRETAGQSFGEMVKAVVDLKREILAIGGELHADAEAVLCEDGSRQEDLWGINIYPDRQRSEWIEFSSLINLKPSLGHRSLEIQDAEVKQKIETIVNSLIE